VRTLRRLLVEAVYRVRMKRLLLVVALAGCGRSTLLLPSTQIRRCTRIFTQRRRTGILGSSYTTLRISDSKSSRISSKRLLHDAYKTCIKLLRA
jgi:hypothetical protein